MGAPGRITSSAGRPAVQSKAGGPRAAFAAALAAAALVGAGCHKAETAAAPGRITPSGLPVPRWVSLRFATVNARGGPGDDYKLLWVYRARGTPLQVVAETDDWRRVCDPDGGLAWVHMRTVESRRTVMRVEPGDLALRRRPSEEAPAAAALVGRSLATLGRCRDGWCEISAGHARGWVRVGEVWGAADGPACTPDHRRSPAG